MMRSISMAAIALVVIIIGGCGGYVLRGRVVESTISDMTWARPGDGRLTGDGIEAVRITVERDADSLGVKQAGQGLSDGDGFFEISVSGFGAGWLSEQWRIIAVRGGFRTAVTDLSLTSTEHKRLLILMTPGASVTRQRSDLLEEFERYK